jgi:hypothetical protein
LPFALFEKCLCAGAGSIVRLLGHADQRPGPSLVPPRWQRRPTQQRWWPRVGPGTVHRVITACQRTCLNAGVVAVGPSPKHGNPDAIRARARPKRACEA